MSADEISISVTRMNDSGANLVQASLGDLGQVSVPFLQSRITAPTPWAALGRPHSQLFHGRR